VTPAPSPTPPDPSWPAWATEPVHVVDHDPRWGGIADRLRHDLDDRLAPWRAGPVAHVGSTAVPGLAAKPTVDLLAPVRDLDAAAVADRVLADAGWELIPPDLDERPWRRSYALPDGDRRVAHLHLVAHDHPKVAATFAFRDALRADPALARRYAELKGAAADRYRHDREAYTAAKADFVEQVLRDVADR
jgi:GrpB-like predicted nucleotidyltransferase (UPF0157 family)